LKQQVELLVELQQIDSERKRIETKKHDLPVELERLKTKLRDFEEKVEEERKKIEDLYERHRLKENELKKGNEALKKTKSRLLEVKTNKEYQALLKEIEVVNGRNDEIESEIINVLEAIDTVKEQLEQEEKEYTVFRSERESDIRKIEEELNSIDSVLITIQKKYGDVKELIHADHLRRYDIIKQKRNNRAVVPVWKEICGGCHMNIPPQMYNELQKYEELMLCPHCNRIIYWDNRDNGES
jgi:predicted  nucleic acid-binding Zn-ribbon protein